MKCCIYNKSNFAKYWDSSKNLFAGFNRIGIIFKFILNIVKFVSKTILESNNVRSTSVLFARGMSSE